MGEEGIKWMALGGIANSKGITYVMDRIYEAKGLITGYHEQALEDACIYLGIEVPKWESEWELEILAVRAYIHMQEKNRCELS